MIRLSISSLFLLSMISAATANDCKLRVSLSPAGSFVADSAAVKILGLVSRKGDQVSAEKISLDLNTLKTGIDLRDEHMKKKYLETEKYPEAVLTHASGSAGKFSGELLVHGVKKPIQGTYAFEGGEFVGTFKTRISDFSIAKARYMGVGVNDEIEVTIRLLPPGSM